MPNTELPDPNTQKSEKRVIEIMGPAEPLDGSKPTAPELLETQEPEELETKPAPNESPEPTPAPDAPDPAEKHVEELMGPAVSLDGSRSKSDVTSAPELPEDTATPVTSATVDESVDEDIDAINQRLKAQVENNEDLDLDAFAASQVKDEADTKKLQDTVADNLAPKAEEPDEAVTAAHMPPPVIMKQSIFARMKNGLLSWWYNPWKRYGLLIFLVAIVGLVLGVSSVRAMVFNKVGVRSGVIVTAYDGTNNLPLEKVLVSVDGIEGKTDADGRIRLKGVKLGEQSVTITKPGFATIIKPVNVDVRVADLGEITLKAVGLQYTYQFEDFISGKPIDDVSVTRGEATTRSDKKGKAILTIPAGDDSEAEVVISSKEYRKESQALPETTEEITKVSLVPRAHDIFVSRASGKYDVYRIYADGKDREVILPGTGLESQDMSISADDSDDQVAVVSTRDNKRNKEGYLLSTLSIVTVADGAVETVDHAERFKLLGWREHTLIYQQTVAGTSAANPNRQKIFAYDVQSGKRYQLASANYFNVSFLVGSKLYYSVSGTDPSADGQFAMVNLDGSNKRTIFNGTVWSVVRSSYDAFSLQSPDNKWHNYTLGSTATKDGAAPSNYDFRQYVDSADLKTAAWVDVRDSNGVLVIRDIGDAKEKDVVSLKGAQSVERWLNSTTVVLRVVGPRETADYVASIDGGQPKLITEITPLQRQ